MAGAPKAGAPKPPDVVYVVTDLPPRRTRPAGGPNPYERALRAALCPVLALAVVVVPVLATTALVAGLLLGWPPLILITAVVLALPVLASLLDLAGARLGWPPLTWTVTRAARAAHITFKEIRRHG